MTPTSPSKAKKAPSKAAAAKAEQKPKEKSFEWRGLTLVMPAEEPGELLFDFADFEEQQRNEEQRIGPMFALVKSLVGGEQFQQIRGKVRADKLSMTDTGDEIAALLNSLLEQYGMGLGESEASQDS